MKRTIFISSLFLLFCNLELHATMKHKPAGMVKIPAGYYFPFYQDRKDSKTGAQQKVTVGSFWLDRFPVTEAQFFDFVQTHPEWGKANVPEIFADAHYLQSANAPNSPVTYVSWFAAKAYCNAQSKRLPSLDEWEFAAQASETQTNGSQDEKFLQRILDWYSRPTDKQLPPIGSVFVNYYGVHDMHGLVWEWVSDFNSIFFTDDARGGKSAEPKLFCAGGVVGASDVKDYAAFMRYAFRASLKANYSVKNLGFRCARDEGTK